MNVNALNLKQLEENRLLRHQNRELFQALSISLSMTESNIVGMDYAMTIYNKYKEQ